MKIFGWYLIKIDDISFVDEKSFMDKNLLVDEKLS